MEGLPALHEADFTGEGKLEVLSTATWTPKTHDSTDASL